MPRKVRSRSLLLGMKFTHLLPKVSENVKVSQKTLTVHQKGQVHVHT